MRGGLKITKIKQSFSGKIEESFLGELSLVDVEEGSMNIYIGYEVKKGLILQMLISSESISLKMVKHMPMRYEKINGNKYLFSKNENTSSKLIIGSHIGVNNFNQDSLQQILFKLQCNPFGGIAKLGEKYLIEIDNGNNMVSMSIDSLGIEIDFSRDPEFSVNEIFDVFKENLFYFSLVKTVKQVQKTQRIQNYSNSSYEENEVEEIIENKSSLSSTTKLLLVMINAFGFVIFLIFLLLWSIKFFGGHI